LIEGLPVEPAALEFDLVPVEVEAHVTRAQLAHLDGVIGAQDLRHHPVAVVLRRKRSSCEDRGD
jgi:hypothetical protein